MARRYHFSSRWVIKARQQAVWDILSDTHGWSSWWGGVTNVLTTGGRQPKADDHVSGTWHALAGYDLALELVMTVVQSPAVIAFTTTGDLDGEGRWSLSETSDGTIIDIDWDVVTTKPWMNRLAPVLGPLFAFSHKRLMSQGERGLQRLVARSR